MADSGIFCPIITALGGGRITRSGRATADKPIEQEKEVEWRQQSAETFLASMDSIGTEAALRIMKSKGSKVAADIGRDARDLQSNAEVGVAFRKAIEAAKKQNRTSEGHRTWQTLLTAAAFCRSANDDKDAEEEEGEQGSMSSKRKAAAMGVREASWSHVNRLYPALFVALKDGELKEAAAMDTGVAPIGVDQPQEIKFLARKAECRMSRAAGTQWHASDQASARNLWENLARDEEPAFVANEGQFDDSLS